MATRFLIVKHPARILAHGRTGAGDGKESKFASARHEGGTARLSLGRDGVERGCSGAARGR